MQLVVSGNRILAHGENFLAMGGTVINTETGKVYQNATVVECENCPADIGEVGYEYHAGAFVPCAPYGKGDGNLAVVCGEDCNAIKDSGLPLDGIINDEIREIYHLDANSTPADLYKVVAPYVVPAVFVTAPTGSTVTLTNGETTLTAEENDGVWLFFPTFGTWTVRAALEEKTETQQLEVTEVKQYKLTLEYTKIYGVYWDGSASPVWSRTDAAADFKNPVPYVGEGGTGSSPFDNCYPWSGMETVIDGTLAASGYDGQMVKIPKFYYKWTRSGDGMKLQIADRNPEWLDGFLVSPAHADRGDGKGERDFVYIAKHKSLLAYEDSTRTEARVLACAVGDGFWLYDFAMYWTICMLYLVEFAHWNSQAKIGRGCANTIDHTLDATSVYHTGTDAITRNTYHGYTKYRDIVGLWSGGYDYVDGVRFEDANIFCFNNPSEYSDISGGTLVGTRCTNTGYITKWTNPTAEGFKYALYPSEAEGAEGEAVCDTVVYSDSKYSPKVLMVGGRGDDASSGFVTNGLFRMDGSNYWGTAVSLTRCMRIMKLP